ncbi:hypothetical protein RI129_009309 [Pyrocoelia pectoralis]|uniref:Major facilitator superfamily (MFS) profile domain-containing protein n=1 Tax=Pyrocoelia pectoralis TaxID=417401 RepID=A0AAN7ZFQ6_9COLE
MYIGEISEKDARGRLVTVQSVLSVIGNVIVLIVGPFINYYDLILLCGIFPAIYLVLFFFMPETPFFLVKIGNIDAARQNVRKLWQRNADPLMIEDKIEAIRASVAHDMENKANLWEMFSNKVYRKPLLITLGLRTVLVCSGIFVLVSYLQMIIESSHSIISPEVSSIIFGTIQVPSVILASVLVDKVGRRPLLIISSIGSGLTLTAEGVYFYLQDHTEADINKISWLPTTSMALYLLLVYFGIYVLPGVVMSELFAINMKTSSCAFISIYGSLLGFIVSKSFQPMSTKLGKHVPFWIFASVCFLGSLFGFFILPETKGKSFLEIQQMLNKNKNLLPRTQGVENN